MFDEVVFECSNCGEQHRVQTKLGDCTGRVYMCLERGQSDIPLRIMQEMSDTIWECPHCEWTSSVTLIDTPTLIVETD
jgi:transcription elongation factor Elf1